MAFGTVLTAATVISTTAANHDISFNAAGIAAVDVMNTNQSMFYICLMTYNDYADVAPIQDGDHSQILLRFSEYSGISSDPRLEIVTTDSTVYGIYSETSYDDDDALLINTNYDGSVSWATLRGDVDTVGSGRVDTSSTSTTAVVTRHYSGKGSDVVLDNRRTYLAFDGSGLDPSKTVSSVTLRIYADNRGHTNDDFGKIIAVQATALAGSTADYGNCFVADAVATTENATFFGANF